MAEGESVVLMAALKQWGLHRWILQARRVLRLCTAVINADRQVDDGESVVPRAAIQHRDLHPDERALVEPLMYGLDFQVMQRRTRRL
jgi:hypothetical protein